MSTLSPDAYLMMGGAEASSVGQRRLGGGAPWPRQRFAGHGLFPCQGGRVAVGVSLKWSGESGFLTHYFAGIGAASGRDCDDGQFSLGSGIRGSSVR
jgi:hypothetical protein